MRVYRVENLYTGKGPYVSGGGWETQDHTDDNHPGPDRDPMLQAHWFNISYGERSDWSFGFESLESLLKWFSLSELASLERNGHCIMWIDLDPGEILFGAKQAIFKKCGRIMQRLGNEITIENRSAYFNFSITYTPPGLKIDPITGNLIDE
jgi:hypothetical protein